MDASMDTLNSLMGVAGAKVISTSSVELTAAAIAAVIPETAEVATVVVAGVMLVGEVGEVGEVGAAAAGVGAGTAVVAASAFGVLGVSCACPLGVVAMTGAAATSTLGSGLMPSLAVSAVGEGTGPSFGAVVLLKTGSLKKSLSASCVRVVSDAGVAAAGMSDFRVVISNEQEGEVLVICLVLA